MHPLRCLPGPTGRSGHTLARTPIGFEPRAGSASQAMCVLLGCFVLMLRWFRSLMAVDLRKLSHPSDKNSTQRCELALFLRLGNV